ncbi:hypothetical protein [Chloroherpeton thalassium]|uniref:hypothetical protein n=1 Tax=Chloroherpeton thalassium TaxID=100716 RepID=UPI0012F83D2B|nr:hypothetical protein [Chloroherpeton thalassium]
MSPAEKYAEFVLRYERNPLKIALETFVKRLKRNPLSRRAHFLEKKHFISTQKYL